MATTERERERDERDEEIRTKISGVGRKRERELNEKSRGWRSQRWHEGVSSIHYRRLPLNGIFVSSSSHCPSSPPVVISVLPNNEKSFVPRAAIQIHDLYP